jgi:His/Glu/Gln/Arg/opine family amino acid ABC transporter permease subunit
MIDSPPLRAVAARLLRSCRMESRSFRRLVLQVRFRRAAAVWERVLLTGCWLTLALTVISVILGFAIGLVTVMATRSRFRLPRLVASGYVEIIRNTPFLVQVLFIYFGLPSLGLSRCRRRFLRSA